MRPFFPPSRTSSRSDNSVGAALMVAAMLGFTFNDAAIKLLGADLGFFQTVFIRSVAVMILLAALCQYRGELRFTQSRDDWGRILIRGMAEVAAAYFFLNALLHMPIGEVTAILQILPLAVTLAAAVFLNEPVGWKRWSAIVIGFFGALLIVRPGTEAFSIYSIYALIAVACVTVRDLASRRMTSSVPSVFAALVAVTMIAIFTGLGSLGLDWQPMTARHWGLVGLAAGFVMVAYIASVSAMRFGEIGFVTPFRYTGVVAALVVGFVLFGERPDALALIGTAIVVGSGLYTLWRERNATR